MVAASAASQKVLETHTCRLVSRRRGRGQSYLEFSPSTQLINSAKVKARMTTTSRNAAFNRLNAPLIGLTSASSFVMLGTLWMIANFWLMIGSGIKHNFNMSNATHIVAVAIGIPAFVIGFIIMLLGIFKVSDPPVFLKAFEEQERLAEALTREYAKRGISFQVVVVKQSLPKKKSQLFDESKAINNVRLYVRVLDLPSDFPSDTDEIAAVSPTNESLEEYISIPDVVSPAAAADLDSVVAQSGQLGAEFRILADDKTKSSKAMRRHVSALQLRFDPLYDERYSIPQLKKYQNAVHALCVKMRRRNGWNLGVHYELIRLEKAMQSTIDRLTAAAYAGNRQDISLTVQNLSDNPLPPGPDTSSIDAVSVTLESTAALSPEDYTPEQHIHGEIDKFAKCTRTSDLLTSLGQLSMHIDAAGELVRPSYAGIRQRLLNTALVLKQLVGEEWTADVASQFGAVLSRLK